MQSLAPQTLKPLTSVRFLAAFWVYLYHCQYATGSPFIAKLANTGYFGVDIFFILSGFILCHVHLRDFTSPADMRKQGLHFIRLRFARIYPLHFVTLFAVLLLDATGLFGWPAENTPRAFAMNLFLLQSFGDGHADIDWNVVSWSISVEWLLYLAFPLFALYVVGRIRSALANLALVAGVLTAFALYFSITGENMSYMHLPLRSILRGALDFAAGAALYNVYARRFLHALPWDAIIVATALMMGLGVWMMAHDIETGRLYFLILSIVLIYALAQARGAVGRLLSCRPLVYLGMISYSFYMWHWIYVIALFLHGDWLWGEPRFLCWQFVVTTFTLIAIASLSYHLIEAPARQWLRERPAF